MPAFFLTRILSILVIAAGVSAAAPQDEAFAIIVRDVQRAVVPAARVTVYPPGAAPRAGSTDAAGVYRLPAPVEGPLLVLVERPGFRRISRVVSARPGEAAEFVLEIAGVDTDVVVTAAGAPETVDRTSKALTVIDGREIEERHEYTLSGVLSAVPGMQVHAAGGPGQLSSLRVRGLRADAVAVLVDGLRFRDAATTQGDASSFLSNLHLIAVDRVEVMRGSGSSLYGAHAAGGVVNVVSDPGGGAPRGAVQMEGGNLGFLRGRARLAGGARADRLKYSAGLLHLNVLRGLDGADRTRGTGAHARLSYDPTARTTISGRVFGSDDFVQNNISPSAGGVPAANIPGAVVPAIALPPDQVERVQQGQTPVWGAATFIPGRDDPDNRRASRFHTAALQAQHAWAAGIGVQAGYQRVHTRRVFANGPAGSGSQPPVPNHSALTGRIDTVDVRAVGTPGTGMQLTAGYEFEHERYTNLQDNNLPGARRIRTETAARQHAHAFHFQGQSSLLEDRLHVSVSGRVQTFALQPPGFAATGIANPYDAAALAAPPRAVTGDLALAYFIAGSGTKLRAHAGNAYRAPALAERFGAGFFLNPATGILALTPFGDPLLAPDRYNSIDGGVDQYLWRDRVRLSATYFYTRTVTLAVFDSGAVIDAGADPYGRTSGYINGSGGLSRGLEWTVEARPTGALTLRAAYTHTRAATDRDLTVPGFHGVFGVPRHHATLVATQRIGRASVTVDLVRHGAFHGNLIAAGRPRAYHYPGYTKIDLSGAFPVRQSDRGALKLTARVDNVLNRRIYDLGWLAPGTTFVTGLNYEF